MSSAVSVTIQGRAVIVRRGQRVETLDTEDKVLDFRAAGPLRDEVLDAWHRARSVAPRGTEELTEADKALMRQIQRRGTVPWGQGRRANELMKRGLVTKHAGRWHLLVPYDGQEA